MNPSLCILIGSHISNPRRIAYLEECLLSLARQTLPIPIYISISFQTEELAKQTIDQLQANNEIVAANRIHIQIRDQKTPQMRHIEKLVNELSSKYDWFMFCDDDDTYEAGRAAYFSAYITKALGEIEDINNATNSGTNSGTDPDQPDQPASEKRTLAGIYESTFGKDHREHRHEYWCYCVHVAILREFYAKLSKYPDVLEDKCCDVLLAEHLRRLSPTKLFARITEKLYNYRIDNNSDSITGVIQTNQPKYTNLERKMPPREQAGEWAEYVIYWNDYLYENMQVYIHDTYLRTLVGCDLDYILRSEFMGNYELIPFVDECHVQKIRDYHVRLRGICNEIYDTAI